MSFQSSFTATILLFIFSACLFGQDESESKIDFDRDIKPILSDRCFTCHGPDSAQRQADLRLDLKDEAMNVVSAGDPDDSELLRRIETDDVDEMMPPVESKLSVSAEEKLLLRKWIEQGAEWKMHWAFEPISHPTAPAVSVSYVVNEIDRFVLAKLESQQLTFSETATKERLIRRLTFDLTGLPPTLQEIDAFLADKSDTAYEQLVDRLLQSKHYGQRMASDWLDVARYSDTYGYQVDRDRFVWPWRDWVIGAFNDNKPYDQFITEQLAGDLLPNASDDQIQATTFNRLHPQKVEGGSVEEQFRVEYVADRTHTFATAFLGLTLECARCHDHKFDPISQKEYYQLFSYFNNIDEAGLYSFFTNSVPTPTLPLLDSDSKKKLAELKSVVDSLSSKPDEVNFEPKDVLRNFQAPTPIEVYDFANANLGQNKKAAGPTGTSSVLLTGDDEVKLKTGNFARHQPFAISCAINTPDIKQRAVVFHRSRAWTDAGSRGYQLLIEEGRLSASLIHFWPGNAIRVLTKKQIPVNQWINVALVYDGSSTANGLAIFIDGQRQELEIVRDNLTKNITGGGGNEIAIGARFRDRGFTGGKVAEFRVFDRQLSSMEIGELHGLIQVDQLKTNPKQLELVDDMIKEHGLLGQDKDRVEYRDKLQAARKAYFNAQNSATLIMVMKELENPRKAYILNRGEYSDRLEEVSAATPSVFPKPSPELPANRLGLARWLTDPQHPLTARVAVNHYWQILFGEGLVRTPEDFGRQGKSPTHPELLDWLASDFVKHEWDVKRLLKQIVMSRTYRQSSDVTAELLQKDPGNELLGRFPSYRLPAEMLRDNVLSVSGLLVDKMGGPPVKPYELAASFKPSSPDAGEGLYRRSLYTYWKRTGPAPVMMTFDAAKRDVCRVKRERTTTPLQTLVMMNGPQFVEGARALSHRLIQQHGENEQEKIMTDMFRLLTSRMPGEQEKSVVAELFEQQLRYFRSNPAARDEYLAIGKYGVPARVKPFTIPANQHVVRVGADAHGKSTFAGQMGRASIIGRSLSQNEIKELFAVDRHEPLKSFATVELATMGESKFKPTENGAVRPQFAGGHIQFAESTNFIFPKSFTVEAWIKPDKLGSRIWDKITPGSGDGFLLDLVGTVRLILGSKVVSAKTAPPVGQWSHLACSVNMETGEVQFYLNGKPDGGIPGTHPGKASDSTDPNTLAAWASVANTLFNLDEYGTKR